MSTTWVLGEYRRADDVYQEHLRIIDNLYDDLKARDDRIRVLERENAELKAKLQALHHRQFKPNQKKDAQTGGKDIEGASSSREGEKKKRGAPVGQKLESGELPWKTAAKIENRSVTELNSPAKRGTNSRFVSNLPRPSGPISQDPSKNLSLPSSSAPAYRPPTITRNSLLDIW